MKFEELQKKSGEIIDKAIERIGIILNEVEVLHPIIKENQVSDFKKEWKTVFSSPDHVDPRLKFEETKFNEKFDYLINRMDDNNKIKARIIEISNQTINELEKIWSHN